MVSLYAPYEAYNKNSKLGESYVLDVDNANFFVAKWDSEIGDAYTRFLIECEKVVVAVAANLFIALKGMTAQQMQMFVDSVKATERTTNP